MVLKTFLTFVLFGLLTIVYAGGENGEQGEGNVVDENGKKQGNWVYFGKDRPSAGYPAEGKIEEGNYVDSRKEGVWIKYHNDGETPKLRGKFVNNRPNGPYVKYHANGEIKEQGTFDRKYRDSLKRFNSAGGLVYESNYNNAGKEQGTVKYFYDNGQEEFVYSSVDGIATGKATRYFENGDVKEVLYYGADGAVEKSEKREMVSAPVTPVNVGASKEQAPKVGQPRTKGSIFKPNGYNKVYNSDDEIWQDGEFRGSRLWDGKVYAYDSDGILLKVKVFKKGVYHSDGQL